MRVFLIIAVLGLSACSQKEEPKVVAEKEPQHAVNAFTNYTDSLRGNVDRARQSVEKANANIAQTQKAVQEFHKSTE